MHIATMEVSCIFGCLFLTLFVAVESEKGPVLSRYCNHKDDCGAYFGYVCGQNQTCHCDRFYTISGRGDKCVGGVGQKCRYDEHCIEGAFCEFQMRCQCKDDLQPFENGLACSKSKPTVITRPHFHAAVSLLLYLLNDIIN